MKKKKKRKGKTLLQSSLCLAAVAPFARYLLLTFFNNKYIDKNTYFNFFNKLIYVLFFNMLFNLTLKLLPSFLIRIFYL